MAGALLTDQRIIPFNASAFHDSRIDQVLTDSGESNTDAQQLCSQSLARVDFLGKIDFASYFDILNNKMHQKIVTLPLPQVAVDGVSLSIGGPHPIGSRVKALSHATVGAESKCFARPPTDLEDAKSCRKTTGRYRN